MNDIDTLIVMISWSPTPKRLTVFKQSLASFRKHTQRRHLLAVVDNGPAVQSEFLDTQDIDRHIKPNINLGVGISRNLGATVAPHTKYIVFVDNDIGYFPGWLNSCIEVLETYPKRKIIATPIWTRPMWKSKRKETLNGYALYQRCAGMSLVMRRRDYRILGQFTNKSNPGDYLCATMKKKGYLFVFDPQWNGQHCDKATYHYKKQIFDPSTGIWTKKESNK